MVCLECRRDIVVVARGLCQSCYLRLKKEGRLPPKKVRVRKICKVDGCNNHVVSHGLCDKHNKRLKRHGHIDKTRPYLDGSKREHHLYETWKTIHRKKGRFPSEWNDFNKFIEDVGDRPSPYHNLVLNDRSGSYCKENLVWVETPCADIGESARDYKSRMQKNSSLKNKYHIDNKVYASLLKKQQGRCAICGSDRNHELAGRSVRLAVDHCHETGIIRGLLCTGCNTALGGFKDSIDNLMAAISYLLKNRS